MTSSILHTNQKMVHNFGCIKVKNTIFDQVQVQIETGHILGKRVKEFCSLPRQWQQTTASAIPPFCLYIFLALANLARICDPTLCPCPKLLCKNANDLKMAFC